MYVDLDNLLYKVYSNKEKNNIYSHVTLAIKMCTRLKYKLYKTQLAKI